jgi:hypothetical protein
MTKSIALTSRMSFYNYLSNLIGSGQKSVQRKRSGISFELREEKEAETVVVIPIIGIVVVPIRETAIPSIVVPGTAAERAVLTLDFCPIFIVKLCIVFHLFFLKLEL